MKGFVFKALLFVFVAAGINACTNKRLENNIKSLERRVAALEGKPKIEAPPTNGAPNTPVVNSGGDTEFPVMTFELTEYNFGSVKEGEIVDYTFRFKNTGTFPLIINKATATCGCTVPQWPKDPIGVGESGEIRVKFNSKNRKNLQTKYVNITANTKPEVTRLKITGNVIAKDDSNS